MQPTSTFTMDRMHVLVERKLRFEIARKDRDLRRMLGHFDMLERVNSEKYLDEAVRPAHHDDTTTNAEHHTDCQADCVHLENVSSDSRDDTSRHDQWLELDKDMVVIEDVEVDEDSLDDSAVSDDGSLTDEDELPDYEDVPGVDSIHIQDEVRHSPPSYVEDAINELNKLSMQPRFEESSYEVSEDD